MKTLIVTTVLCLFLTAAQAQDYASSMKNAEALYYKKEYLQAARTYTAAFIQNGWKTTQNDVYNAACNWSLAGNADSAFHYLDMAVHQKNYDDYAHITIDSDLDPLHEDKRWAQVLADVQSNRARVEANYIKPVVAVLDTVYQEDQRYRQGIVEMIQKEGMRSPNVQERLKKMSYADSVNLIKVQNILDEYGWLGPDRVGRYGALTIFLVIQHAPLKVQQKYLPMMREAVKNGKAGTYNLVLLEDRVAIGEGRKQLYGSQVQTDTVTHKNFLLPLEDPDHVDERRARMGLEPLADYLRPFGIDWNVEAYKREQAEAAKKKKGA